VICTGGGPTDEFTTDTFARRIPSRFHTEPLLEQALGVGARCLVPDTERFAQLIVEVAADVAWRGGGAQAGVSFLYSRCTWRQAADRLVEVLKSAAWR
jgi:hypothetical protein